ncbi:MAG: polysaccharide deacetylase family protein [Paludibacter sp.]
MKTLLMCLVWLSLLLNTYAQEVKNSALVINPDQATGGEIIKTDKGHPAVLFPAAMPLDSKITWSLPTPLQTALWKIDIDFYQPNSPFATDQILQFENESGEKIGKIDLSAFSFFMKGTYTRSIGFYSNKPLKYIKLIKIRQRNLNTVAITSIKIVPGLASELEKMLFSFQISGTDNQLKVPLPLPLGAYLINYNKSTSLKWMLNGGQTFETPSTNEVRIFLDERQPALQVTANGAPLQEIQIAHFPVAATPDMTDAGNAPLMVLCDLTKTETQTLQLIGYKGTELPKVDIFPGGKSMAIVTSWDDGNPQDEQVAEYLVKYHMKGTFYMNHYSKMNSNLSVLENKGMEVGSHSWSHPFLHLSSPKRCLDETVEMRRYLEKITGHPIISFAYPYGYRAAYNQNGDYVLEAVKQAGYWSARITVTGDNQIDAMNAPLVMSPNFHFNVGAAKTSQKYEELRQKPGSILYIWGHSYEIAGEGAKTLDDVLASVANRPEAWYATLGELMIWQFTKSHLKIAPTTAKKSSRTFELKLPWLNPYLRKVPVSLILPNGVNEVLWQGEKIAVVNNRVQLKWSEN